MPRDGLQDRIDERILLGCRARVARLAVQPDFSIRSFQGAELRIEIDERGRAAVRVHRWIARNDDTESRVQRRGRGVDHGAIASTPATGTEDQDAEEAR